MTDFISLLMAIFFLVAGVLCINRPKQIINWSIAFFSQVSTDMPDMSRWTQSSGVIFFIRLLGFLALINASMQIYLLSYSPPPFPG